MPQERLSIVVTVLITIFLTLGFQRFIPSPVLKTLLPHCSATPKGSDARHGLFNEEKIFVSLPAIGSNRELPPANRHESGTEAFSRADFQAPALGGFLRIVDERGEKRMLGISMFHQLHCLDMMKAMLIGSATHQPMLHNFTLTDEAGRTMVIEEETEEHHWMHCFDYLAQGIACAADDTLEEPLLRKDESTGKSQFLITGMGVSHQCRSIAPIRDAVLDSVKRPYFMHSADKIRSFHEMS